MNIFAEVKVGSIPAGMAEKAPRAGTDRVPPFQKE